MKTTQAMVFLLLITGCAANSSASRPGVGGSGGSPSSGTTTAVKQELPWIEVPGGRMKTTLFYGPWQCRQSFMKSCQLECAQHGHPLMGCMWLADIKFDWMGTLVLLPLPVEAGSRYAIWHCCCQYPELSAAETATRRKEWSRVRKSFRKEWSERFGQWPEEAGVSWPGHHIRDLWHSGNPVDPNNIIPAQPGVHEVYNDQYPACYKGQSPWNTSGPDFPYRD